MAKLDYSFFVRHSVLVAQELIGKTLVFNDFEGIITETEAYRGLDDEASHAHKGASIRSKIMFGPPGVSYVYLIYGMYNCFNIVTEEDGMPSAVLIRGLKLANKHLDGPGKICKTLGINRGHNGISLIESNDFYVRDDNHQLAFETTKRIGISKAQDKLWRFVIKKGIFANLQ